jgi:hypothetical protein
LKHIYKSVNRYTDDIARVSHEIKIVVRELTVLTEAILYLLKLRAKLSDEKYGILKDAFPLENILTNIDDSWEDITLTNMTNILKFYFTGEKSKY